MIQVEAKQQDTLIDEAEAWSNVDFTQLPTAPPRLPPSALIPVYARPGGFPSVATRPPQPLFAASSNAHQPSHIQTVSRPVPSPVPSMPTFTASNSRPMPKATQPSMQPVLPTPPVPHPAPPTVPRAAQKKTFFKCKDCGTSRLQIKGSSAKDQECGGCGKIMSVVHI